MPYGSTRVEYSSTFWLARWVATMWIGWIVMTSCTVLSAWPADFSRIGLIYTFRNYSLRNPRLGVASECPRNRALARFQEGVHVEMYTVDVEHLSQMYSWTAVKLLRYHDQIMIKSKMKFDACGSHHAPERARLWAGSAPNRLWWSTVSTPSSITDHDQIDHDLFVSSFWLLWHKHIRSDLRPSTISYTCTAVLLTCTYRGYSCTAVVLEYSNPYVYL